MFFSGTSRPASEASTSSVREDAILRALFHRQLLPSCHGSRLLQYIKDVTHTRVLGCMASDCHYLVCPVLESALAQSLGPRLLVFGLVSNGVPPRWRHVAVAAEVVNSAGHVRSAAETVALAMTQAGCDRMQSTSDGVA